MRTGHAARAAWRILGAAALSAVAPASLAQQQPIEIRGDSAQYSPDGSRAEFSGNVVLTADGVTLHADRIVVSVGDSGGAYRAEGNPARAECGGCMREPISVSAKSFFLDEASGAFEASGGLEVCAGPQCAAGLIRAQRAVWRRPSGEAEMAGSPALAEWRPPDEAPLRVEAELITYRSAAGDVVLSGDALLQRGGEEIRGARIGFNIKTGTLSAEGGDGRVRGVFGAPGGEGGDG